MTLACIERVLVNVAVRQIAAPRRGFALTEVKVNSNRYFTACHSRASGVLLIVCRHSPLHYLYIGDVQVVNQGMPPHYKQDAAPAAMAGSKVTIPLDLHLGEGKATAWGCDLTHGYIDENTLYTR